MTFGHEALRASHIALPMISQRHGAALATDHGPRTQQHHGLHAERASDESIRTRMHARRRWHVHETAAALHKTDSVTNSSGASLARSLASSV